MQSILKNIKSVPVSTGFFQYNVSRAIWGGSEEKKGTRGKWKRKKQALKTDL